MRVKRIHHVGIAVSKLSDATPTYQKLLGLSALGVETVEDQGVRVEFYQVGESKIECLESVRPDGPIARFLASRGTGIHHLALEVEAIEAALSKARENGVRLLDERPRRGAGGNRIAFLHPKDTGGVLIELVEPKRR